MQPDWIFLVLVISALQWILLNYLSYQTYSYTFISINNISLLSFYCLEALQQHSLFHCWPCLCFSFFLINFVRYFSFLFNFSKKQLWALIFSIICSLFYWFSVLPLLFPFTYFWFKLFFLFFLFKVRLRTLISDRFFFSNINI